MKFLSRKILMGTGLALVLVIAPPSFATVLDNLVAPSSPTLAFQMQFSEVNSPTQNQASENEVTGYQAPEDVAPVYSSVVSSPISYGLPGQETVQPSMSYVGAPSYSISSPVTLLYTGVGPSAVNALSAPSDVSSMFTAATYNQAPQVSNPASFSSNNPIRGFAAVPEPRFLAPILLVCLGIGIIVVNRRRQQGSSEQALSQQVLPQ